MHSIFTFLILLSLTTSITHACFTAKWHIFVTNDINDDIVAHIKSGDDDLGNHTIPFNGNYNWSFCNRFDGRTLFYAYFWWGSRYQSLDLFNSDIEDICAVKILGTQNCYWLVRSNGFFVSAYNRTFSDRDWKLKKTWNY
ncbi:hypothetical protein SSX86_029198 [Deinandra increscens subsp. villosa]|uniref:S-protein homolog n=1 Tax=Deinandra increscens subsp. villosa TaxID=3103831 RepID=A0AAP0CFX7_9ASTR